MSKYGFCTTWKFIKLGCVRGFHNRIDSSSLTARYALHSEVNILLFFSFLLKLPNLREHYNLKQLAAVQKILNQLSKNCFKVYDEKEDTCETDVNKQSTGEVCEKGTKRVHNSYFQSRDSRNWFLKSCCEVFSRAKQVTERITLFKSCSSDKTSWKY